MKPTLASIACIALASGCVSQNTNTPPPISVGMSIQQVEQICGQPTGINRWADGAASSGVTEMRHYRAGQCNVSVGYIENKVVSYR